MGEKEELIQMQHALVEMYKAGFLDGYSVFNKPRKDIDFQNLNKAYKEAFMVRFEKKLDKILTKRCKGVKKNDRRKK